MGRSSRKRKLDRIDRRRAHTQNVWKWFESYQSVYNAFDPDAVLKTTQYESWWSRIRAKIPAPSRVERRVLFNCFRIHVFVDLYYFNDRDRYEAAENILGHFDLEVPLTIHVKVMDFEEDEGVSP